MSWAKLDDAYPSHPKMLAAGLDALGFDVCGICYCSKYLTDGFISDAALAAVYPPARNPRKLADRLVEVGRWDREEGGYRVRDYHDYNPTRASVETERERSRKRMREHRANKSRSSGEHTENFDGGRSAVPTRPDPSPSSLNTSSSPPINTNGYGGGGVDFPKVVVALLKQGASLSSADREAAMNLLQQRVEAGETPTSPVAWTLKVASSMAEKRKAAAKADEPKREVFEGEWHTYDCEQKRWVPDSERQEASADV